MTKAARAHEFVAGPRCLWLASLTAVAVAVGLLVPGAVAKDFRPGDLRICGRAQCVAIVSPSLVRALSSYYWGPTRLTRTAQVQSGVPAFALRDRRGLATAIVATRRLDRFRAHGFFCERFERGKWYRLPRGVAAALRTLTKELVPLRVSVPPPSC